MKKGHSRTAQQTGATLDGGPALLGLGQLRSWAWVLLAALMVTGCRESSQAGPGAAPSIPEFAPGISYTNERIARGPWSIHVVKAARGSGEYGFVSVHAKDGALGLATLSQQVAQVPRSLGIPVAAVNGDFYQRDRTFAGDPRGLQVVRGEMISSPIGGVAFWVDARGEPNATNILPNFRLTWSGGSLTNFGLNEDRQPNEVALYTRAVGNRTRTSGGREWVLVPAAGTNEPPVARPGGRYGFQVASVAEGGNASIPKEGWVLSAGAGVVRRQTALASLVEGTRVEVEFATTPDLREAVQAISGGPLLVHRGKALKIVPPRADSYEFSSMLERHPRSALGWSRTHLYLVQVDGRQPRLSVGMTLEELGATLQRLGCEEGMNLDGGGSATFWCDGQVRNSPCDGGERVIANSLVLVRRPGQGP